MTDEGTATGVTVCVIAMVVMGVTGAVVSQSLQTGASDVVEAGLTGVLVVEVSDQSPHTDSEVEAGLTGTVVVEETDSQSYHDGS